MAQGSVRLNTDKIVQTRITDVLIIEPKVFTDERGLFYESYNQRAFSEKAGITAKFVQDNQSHSKQNVLRGLHYQIQQPQGKLVRAIASAIISMERSRSSHWLASVRPTHSFRQRPSRSIVQNF